MSNVPHNHLKLLSSLKTMDFESFINSYPNMGIYPKNSIKIFGKKLKDIFEILKSNGDSYLNVKDCSCTCVDCKKKYHERFIYAFIGDRSGDYFALAINIRNNYEPVLMRMPNDLEYNIDTMVDDTMYNEATQEFRFGKKLSFTIADDENDGFIVDDDYLDLISFRNKAFEELELKNKTINTYEELKDWITKYKIEDRYLTLDYQVLKEFNAIYSDLKQFCDMCEHIEMAKKAMHGLASQSEDTRLVHWLMKYEDFYNEKFGILSVSFLYEEDGYIELNKSNGYKLAISIFEDIVPFLEYFHNHYFEEIETVKSKYLEQQNLTAVEFDEKRIYIENQLSYFYNLLNLG